MHESNMIYSKRFRKILGIISAIVLVLSVLSIMSMLWFKPSEIAYEKGLACAKNKDYNSAIGYYTKVIDDNRLFKNDLSKVYCNRGFAYLHIGFYDAAIMDFDKCYRLDPNDKNFREMRYMIGYAEQLMEKRGQEAAEKRKLPEKNGSWDTPEKSEKQK